MEVIKVGGKVTDSKSRHYKVKSVLRDKKNNVTHIVLRQPNQDPKKITLKTFKRHYKVNDYASDISIAPTYHSANPVAKEMESVYNSLFPDRRWKPFDGIIGEIKKAVENESKFNPEPDMDLVINELQTRHNLFLSKTGPINNTIAKTIVVIDWLGLDDIKLKDYFNESLEIGKDYNVVMINTRNKTKKIFINALKSIIIKYKGAK